MRPVGELLIVGHCSIDQKGLTLGTASLRCHFGIDGSGTCVLRWTVVTHMALTSRR